MREDPGGDATPWPEADEIVRTADALGAAQRAIRVQAVAMWVFTGAAAIAVLFLLGQALSRHITADAAENAALRAVGMTTSQVLIASLARAAVVALAGALGAVVVAVVASPLTPVGLARQAEPHGGVTVNAAILAIGAVAVFALFTAWVVPAARRANRGSVVARRGARRPARIVGAVEGWGLPAPATNGIAMAIDSGRGTSGVPVRSTLVTVVVAVAALTAAFTFGASLRSLARTPTTYGWNFDVAVGNPNNGFNGPADANSIGNQARRALASDDDVAAFTGIAFGDISAAGRNARAMGVDTARGMVLPSLIDGRHPEGDDEVAMTGSALRHIHRRVGDPTTLETPSGTVRVRIVGRIAAPANVLSQTQGGEVVELRMATLARLQPGATASLFFVRYRNGVAPSAAYRRLRQAVGPVVLRAIRPAEVENLLRIAWMPWALAALLLVIGLGTLGHLLVASVRRRRHELAILKTLGFSRRQVSATVAWQATTLAVLALAIGIPLGVATGRSAWRIVATGADVVSRPIAPALTLAIGAVVTVAIANVVAAGPAWVAGRYKPGRLLRAE